jgi:hypothetical protein
MHIKWDFSALSFIKIMAQNLLFFLVVYDAFTAGVKLWYMTFVS